MPISSDGADEAALFVTAAAAAGTVIPASVDQKKCHIHRNMLKSSVRAPSLHLKSPSGSGSNDKFSQYSATQIWPFDVGGRATPREFSAVAAAMYMLTLPPSSCMKRCTGASNTNSPTPKVRTQISWSRGWAVKLCTSCTFLQNGNQLGHLSMWRKVGTMPSPNRGSSARSSWPSACGFAWPPAHTQALSSAHFTKHSTGAAAPASCQAVDALPTNLRTTDKSGSSLPTLVRTSICSSSRFSNNASSGSGAQTRRACNTCHAATDCPASMSARWSCCSECMSSTGTSALWSCSSESASSTGASALSGHGGPPRHSSCTLLTGEE
mmetsp:Transcript_16822/g.46352  ORF Transcript_16822/g.46352 Transcript_16822/m.46352 type:complete len:324 (-) Transcript_16822:98-1069(-)